MNNEVRHYPKGSVIMLEEGIIPPDGMNYWMLIKVVRMFKEQKINGGYHYEYKPSGHLPFEEVYMYSYFRIQ